VVVSEPVDDAGQALVERYFVYRDDWAVSCLYRCDSGHMTLFSSRFDTGASDTWTCTRYVSGAPCRRSMTLYVPDDEGLTPLQWAKRALAREGKRREEDGSHFMRLGKAIEDLSALVVLAGPDRKEATVKSILEEIRTRPAVKRLLDWLA
jgi:hypothetical protein